MPNHVLVDIDGHRFDTFIGRTDYGYYIAIPNWHVCVEAAEPDNVLYNAGSLRDCDVPTVRRFADEIATKIFEECDGYDGRFYTVVINRNEPECDPWVTPFSSRNGAEKFAQEVHEKIEALDIQGVSVSMDSMELDSKEYIDWLDEI